MLLLWSGTETIAQAEVITQKQTIPLPDTHFDIRAFSRFIDRFGVQMKYYQSVLCSCVMSNNGHPSKDCDCSNGYWYPYAPIELTLLRTQVQKRSDRDRIGQVESGACQITVPVITYTGADRRGNATYEDCEIYHSVAIGDVFVIPNRRKRDRDILKKGVNDKIKAFDVQQIFSVTTEDLTFYTYGTDFQFNETTRDIEWLPTGTSPQDGQNYTVEFESLLQYIVYQDLDKDRGGEDDYLPKRFVCNSRVYVNFDDSNPLDVQP